LASSHSLVDEGLLYANIGSGHFHSPDLVWAEACNLLRYDNRATLFIEEGSLRRTERSRDKAALAV
jgi:hypothetical protein